MAALPSYLFVFLATYVSLTLCLDTAQNSTSLSGALLETLGNAEKTVGSNQTNSLETSVREYTKPIDELASASTNCDDRCKARTACDILGYLLGNRTVVANSSAYESEKQDAWSTTCWLPAACFAQLQSPAEVATALRVITFIESKFAIRSRGHNDNPGASSINESGVLLDLKGLNSVIVNSDASVVGAQPGASWGSVYSTLDPHNVSAVGGRDADVGVAGLILGGGFPYFPNLFGLAAANVKNFEVVLADSSITNANVDENPDLFYALKGGGPNYGIISRIDLQTVPLQKVWYNLAIYKESDHDSVLAATARLHEFASNDPKLGYFMNSNPQGLFVGLLYAEWTEFPSAFEPFKNLTPAITIATPTNGTIIALAQAISGNDPSTRRFGAAISHRFNSSLYNATHSKFRSESNFTGSDTGGLSYTIQPINGPRVSDLDMKNGGSPFTINPVDQDWIVITASWSSENNDVHAISAVESVRSDIQDRADQSGDLLDLIFMNDAASDQAPLKSYGADVFEKLEATAKTYDPDGVFQKLQGGGFLLSKE